MRKNKQILLEISKSKKGYKCFKEISLGQRMCGEGETNKNSGHVL